MRNQKSRASIVKSLHPMTRQILKDSELKSGATSEIIAVALDAALEQLQALRRKQDNQKGGLAVDEARSLPALMSNIKRLCDMLGVVEHVLEDEDDL